MKRIAVISLCIGAGFALVSLLGVGGYLWYRSRPKTPTPWNTAAITARFDEVGTEGGLNTITFSYTLQNTTSADYRVADRSELSIAAKLRRQHSLSMMESNKVLNIDCPIFIPPGQRVLVVVHLAYPYAEKSPASDASAEDRKKFRETLRAYIEKKMANLDGFVVYDNEHRYQIELPRGW